jgi:hypothetical protein
MARCIADAGAPPLNPPAALTAAPLPPLRRLAADEKLRVCRLLGVRRKFCNSGVLDADGADAIIHAVQMIRDPSTRAAWAAFVREQAARTPASGMVAQSWDVLRDRLPCLP